MWLHSRKKNPVSKLLYVRSFLYFCKYLIFCLYVVFSLSLMNVTIIGKRMQIRPILDHSWQLAVFFSELYVLWHVTSVIKVITEDHEINTCCWEFACGYAIIKSFILVTVKPDHSLIQRQVSQTLKICSLINHYVSRKI